MKIALMSDLHLEFYPVEPIDALNEILGDTDYSDCVGIFDGDIYTRYRAPDIIDQVKHRFKQVIFVPGNHDLWGAGIQDIGSHSVDKANRTVWIDGVQFVCAVGWAYREQKFDPMEEIVFKNSLHEHQKITNTNNESFRFEWEDWLNLAKKDMDFIFQPKASTARKKVVITHYPPSRHMSDPKFDGDPANFLFCSEYDHILQDGTGDIDVWLSGHTHYRMQHQIGDTTLHSNPMGYPGELDSDYQPLIIEIP